MCVQALKQHKYCLPSIIRIKIGTMCVGTLLISINSYDSLGDIYATLGLRQKGIHSRGSFIGYIPLDVLEYFPLLIYLQHCHGSF